MTKYFCTKSANTLFEKDFFKKNQIYFVKQSTAYGVSMVYDYKNMYKDTCLNSFIFEHLISLAEYREKQINSILNET